MLNNKKMIRKIRYKLDELLYEPNKKTDDIVQTIIKKTVTNTNLLVNRTILFLNLYLVHLVENSLSVPIIDKYFIRYIFKILVDVNRDEIDEIEEIDEIVDEKQYQKLVDFYNSSKCKKLGFSKIKLDVPKDMLDIITQDVVNDLDKFIIENLFKAIFKFIVNSVSITNRSKNKSFYDENIAKMLSDLEHNTDYSDIKNTEMLDLIKQEYLPDFTTEKLLKEPQTFLKTMIKLNYFFPTKITHRKIPITTKIAAELFNTTKNVWTTLFNIKNTKIDTYRFANLIYIDTYSATLYYVPTYNSNYNISYLESLDDIELDDVKNNRYIVIDPGQKTLLTIMGESDANDKRVWNLEGKNYMFYTYTKELYLHITNEEQCRQKMYDFKQKYSLFPKNPQINKTNMYELYVKDMNQIFTRLTKMEKPELDIYRWYTYLYKQRAVDKLISSINRYYNNPKTIIVGDFGYTNDYKLYKYKTTMKLIKQLSYHFDTYFVDEYNTSKISYQTHNRCTNLQQNGNKLFKVLTFKKNDNSMSCINRDKNATINIKTIVDEWLNSKQKPKVFQRTNYAIGNYSAIKCC